MNKKIKIGLFVLIILGTITLCLTYKSNDKVIKTKKRKQNNLAIMIKEDGATDYVQSNSNDIPKGNYVLNRDKSYCKNNGKIGNYDSSLGKVSFSFIGTDSCFLYFDYDSEPKGYEKILLDNGNGATTVDAAKAYIEGRTTSTAPDFSTVATTNEGMYAAKDDLGTSYYFRGAVDNNWVKYGKYTKDMYNCNNDTISVTDTGNSCTKIASSGDDMYWRIIRINGDNSIRMIYSGVTPPTESTKVKKTEDNSLGNSPFNTKYDSAEYVGYMYTIGEQHGTSKSSDIKTYLDDWYANYTNLNATGTKITDQIFCNDRTASTSDVAYSTTNYTTLTSWNSTETTYYYGAHGRIDKDNNPMLTCAVDSDRFTVNKINGKGNSALTYPVGLITIDELEMAGNNSRERNTSYYLHTGDNYWLGSPHEFYVVGNGAIEFRASDGGFLGIAYVNASLYEVRGVISLSSESKLLGSGTYDDVYTVVGGNSTEDTSSGKSFDTVFAANNTDIFDENGYRYEGANPNNYICLDNQKSGSCVNSSLLFRIIGLFDEDTSSDGTSSSGTKKLLKIIDTNNYGGTSGKYWNSAGTNNWSTASLKTELNDPYLRTLLDTIGVNSKLNDAIVKAKWHLGGASSSNSDTLTAEGIYTEERNTSAIYSGNPSSIYAQVGLMYPSDYGYATVGGTTTNRAGCREKAVYDYDTADCKNNDWLFTSQSSFVNSGEWLLSPCSSYSNVAAYLNSSGYVGLSAGSVGSGLFAVRPTFYLDSSVLKIVGGTGTSDNAYRIG